ncbi:MAG: hypothetical protein RUMPE_00948 [Eubacteriales bacterium SKADARSKE-1]|nr:hypothetical protein [Eubacteriales bacterium SKADARSKE-1]
MELLKVKPKYQQILMDMEDGLTEETEIFYALDLVKDEFEVKADNVACVIKNLDAEETLIIKEMEKLFERANEKRHQSIIFKKYLKHRMINNNIVKVETPRNYIRLKKTSEFIIEQKKFIDWAQDNAEHLINYVKPYANKIAIKKAIRAGENVLYAKFQGKKKVVIE